MECVEDDVLMFINWKYVQPNQLHFPRRRWRSILNFLESTLTLNIEHAAGVLALSRGSGVQQLYSTTLTWYCGEQIAVSQHPQQTIMQHCSTAVCWYRAQSFIICKLSNCIFLRCLCSVASTVHHSSLTTSNVETKSSEGYSKINVFCVFFTPLWWCWFKRLVCGAN